MTDQEQQEMDAEYEIVEAKRNLYHLLLKKSNDELTSNEASLLFDLASDDAIQEILTP